MIISLLVEGGKATSGPPLGPALGPLKIDINKVVQEINNKTKEFEGMKVNVKVIVDENKNVKIEVGTPPTSALILKEIGAQKGAKSKEEVAGNISLNQVIKIAKIKRGSSLSKTLKNVVLEVLGTCLSMNVTCEGKNPKEIIKEIKEGKIKIEES
jgi:large subunit ribosomal protein L11